MKGRIMVIPYLKGDRVLFRRWGRSGLKPTDPLAVDAEVVKAHSPEPGEYFLEWKEGDRLARDHADHGELTPWFRFDAGEYERLGDVTSPNVARKLYEAGVTPAEAAILVSRPRRASIGELVDRGELTVQAAIQVITGPGDGGDDSVKIVA